MESTVNLTLLASGELLPVVHSITSKYETGVLHLWDDVRRKKIYFVDGRPDYVASTTKEGLLGQYLVAAGLCLGVAHVDMVSVAGVAPILVHLARTGETWQVSGVGPYPRASTVEYFEQRHGGQIPPGLARTVVPAAPDAWCTALERWGTMSFADVARAATEHAERGFPVSGFSAYQMGANAEKYRRWPTSATRARGCCAAARESACSSARTIVSTTPTSAAGSRARSGSTTAFALTTCKASCTSAMCSC